MQPLLHDFGMSSVGYWKAPDDSTFNYIVEHQSLEAIEPSWDRLHAALRFLAGLAKYQGKRQVVLDSRSTPMVGVPGLPPLAAA